VNIDHRGNHKQNRLDEAISIVTLLSRNMFQILVGKENFLTEVFCVPQVLHVNAVTEEDFFRRSLKAEAGRISLLGFSVPSGK